MVAQEVRDVEKQMSYVRGLEKKLQGKDPNTHMNTEDFEMLSKFKKDLGLDVNFKTETEKREEIRAARAGYVSPDKKAAEAKKAEPAKK